MDSLAKKTVYIIENDVILQRRIAALVRQSDFLEVVGTRDLLPAETAELQRAAPDVLILDATQRNLKWPQEIGRLRQALPQTLIVCTHHAWREEAVQSLLECGVASCLVKPFDKAELLELLTCLFASAAAEAQKKQGKLVAFFSPKGGYGKSSLVVNMALGLAAETGRAVSMIDANFQFGDLAVFCNVTPEASVYEAARDLAQLTPQALGSYFTPYKDAVKLLAAPLRPEQGDLISSEQIAGVSQMTKELFSYVVVDAPSGFNDISLAITQAADVVYVLCAVNTGLELKHLRRSLEYFHELGYDPDKLRVVINRAPQRSLGALRAIEEQLGHPVVTLLPNDFNLAVTASNQGEPMIAVNPEAGLVRGIMDLVRNASGE